MRKAWIALECPNRVDNEMTQKAGIESTTYLSSEWALNPIILEIRG